MLQILKRVLKTNILAPELGGVQCEILLQFFVGVLGQILG